MFANPTATKSPMHPEILTLESLALDIAAASLLPLKITVGRNHLGKHCHPSTVLSNTSLLQFPPLHSCGIPTLYSHFGDPAARAVISCDPGIAGDPRVALQGHLEYILERSTCSLHPQSPPQAHRPCTFLAKAPCCTPHTRTSPAF